jgi:hypothetical protein
MNTEVQRAFSELVAPAELIPADGRELGLELSLSMRNSYEFHRLRFIGRGQELLVIIVKAQMPVDLIGRQYQRLQSQSERPIILVFKELKARERHRLMRRKVQFMIPGKFLYAPMLGFVGETPQFEGRWDTAVNAARLSPWAETILIKRLLDDALELASGIELAKRFAVTPMTISRALSELEAFDLCFLEQQGTEKKVRFEAKNILWHKAANLLISPVVATIDLAEIPVKLPLSGDPALEHYTMLVGLPPPAYAISKREFLALKKSGKVMLPKPGEEQLRLELWRRDPRALAQGDYVDPVSLYLSVKNSPDERIQLETRRMMTDLGFRVNDNE